MAEGLQLARLDLGHRVLLSLLLRHPVVVPVVVVVLLLFLRFFLVGLRLLLNCLLLLLALNQLVLLHLLLQLDLLQGRLVHLRLWRVQDQAELDGPLVLDLLALHDRGEARLRDHIVHEHRWVLPKKFNGLFNRHIRVYHSVRQVLSVTEV